MADEFIPGYATADDLRREALYVQRAHNPANQEGNGYDRCELCHYTRHPCESYDLATTILALLDRERPDA